MKRLIRIDFADVKPFIKDAKKERVSFLNPVGSEWYGIEEEGNLISFCCLVIKNGSARFKSNYTIPEKRKQGCLRMLIDYSIFRCKLAGIKTMTAFCTPLSINQHIRHGAKMLSKKGDITYVKYILA